jgi:hypothetical protein
MRKEEREVRKTSFKKTIEKKLIFFFISPKSFPPNNSHAKLVNLFLNFKKRLVIIIA